MLHHHIIYSYKRCTLYIRFRGLQNLCPKDCSAQIKLWCYIQSEQKSSAICISSQTTLSVNYHHHLVIPPWWQVKYICHHMRKTSVGKVLPNLAKNYKFTKVSIVNFIHSYCNKLILQYLKTRRCKYYTLYNHYL